MSLPFQFLRVAFVHQWGDVLIMRLAQSAPSQDAEMLVRHAEQAAQALGISALRGGDPKLDLDAAQAFGFETFADFEVFRQENPCLTVATQAEPALQDCEGVVEQLSMTEVVLRTEDTLLVAIDRAHLPDEGAHPGARLQVRRYGRCVKVL